MYLYNSATHRKEEFQTHTPGHVEMYTCGPTVYHFAHIGNLRSYIMEDVLEKFLRYAGYSVNRVMNITDVGHLSSDADTGEDKMLKGAKREHKTVMEIAQFYTDAFFQDCAKLNIKTPSADQIVGNLSGGNQQKIVIAKWLLNDPDIIILDEPTRGIDVGAKRDIYLLLGNLVRQGKAVIMISSEIPELMGICDRIMVMCEGNYSGEVSREEFSQERIMTLASAIKV